MAKSMRSKREKRLRAIRRDMVEPFYDKKDAAKFAALEAALSAPKLPVPVKSSPFASSSSAMDLTANTAAAFTAPTTTNDLNMDVEIDDGNQTKSSLKPLGKKLKRKLKLSKSKRRGKGKFKRRHI